MRTALNNCEYNHILHQEISDQPVFGSAAVVAKRSAVNLVGAHAVVPVPGHSDALVAAEAEGEGLGLLMPPF
jgi:hypothetical protein